MNNKAKTALQYLILLLAIPAVILLGVTVFKDASTPLSRWRSRFWPAFPFSCPLKKARAAASC